MKTLCTCLLCWGLCFTALAQDLIIQYDVTSDQITFVDTAGHPISRPAAKKNRNVLLRLINFNDYTLDASVKATGINDKIAEGNINLVGGKILGQESPDFSQFIGNQSGAAHLLQLNAMTVPTSYSPGRSIEHEETAQTEQNKNKEESDKKASPGTIKTLEIIQQKYTVAVQKLEELNTELIQAERKIINHKNTILLTEYAVPYMESIQYNERISTKKRKALLQEMMAALFQMDEKEMQLTNILDFFTTFEGNVHADLNLFEQLNNRFANQFAELLTIHDAISENYIPGLPLAEKLKSQASQKIKFYQNTEQDLAIFGQQARAFKAQLPAVNIPLLFEKIYRNYLTISTNPFEYSFTAPAEGDLMDFEISIFRKDTLRPQNKLLKKRSIKIPVKGGVKVNTSMGIGFGRFFDPVENFYNRDSTIFAESGDQFTPLFVTMIHFYPQSGRQVTVGGSFGVGVPLSGDFKSPSFLLGPSIFAGKSERMVISGGIMGAKAIRLARGYKVGDYFGATGQAIPTSARYEFGYFLSATFNLSR